MIGAIEFLTKAKAICESETDNEMSFTIIEYLNDTGRGLPTADLVRKVMAYQLPTDEFDGEKEYEEAMKQDFNICDICEDNQIMNCAYLENGDRKSCSQVMAYQLPKEDKDAERN